MSTILEFKNVHQRFGATEVLRGIDLSISAGERVALIGGQLQQGTAFFTQAHAP